MNRHARMVMWARVIAYAGSAVALVLLGSTRVYAERGIGGYVIGAGIVVLVIVGGGALDAWALSTVGRWHPQAAVATVYAYDLTIEQLNAITVAKRQPSAPTLRRNGHYPVVVDRNKLRIFAGLPLSPAVSIRLTSIAAVTQARVALPVGSSKSIRLLVRDGDTVCPLDLCLGSARFLIPTVASASFRYRFAASIRILIDRRGDSGDNS